jgi:hypothetical protein
VSISNPEISWNALNWKIPPVELVDVPCNAWVVEAVRTRSGLLKTREPEKLTVPVTSTLVTPAPLIALEIVAPAVVSV